MEQAKHDVLIVNSVMPLMGAVIVVFRHHVGYAYRFFEVAFFQVVLRSSP